MTALVWNLEIYSPEGCDLNGSSGKGGGWRFAEFGGGGRGGMCGVWVEPSEWERNTSGPPSTFLFFQD